MTQEINMPAKKKWYKKKLFYIILASVLVVGGIVYGQMTKNNSAVVWETVKVERGDLVQTVDASGNVKSANEIDLRFEVGGKVEKIYKKINDPVKANELIMDLDLKEANAAVAGASANVQRARADLDRVLAGKTEEYINSLEARLAKTQADLEQIRNSSQASIDNASSALETAEANLKLVEGGDISLIVEDAYADMLALLYTTQNTLSDSLSQADKILGIDDTIGNDDFEYVLSLLDSSKLSSAKNKYYSAKADKIDTDGVINPLNSSSLHEQIDYGESVAEEALISMKDLLYSVSLVLDNTNAVGNLTQTELDAFKTNIQTARSNIATKYAYLIDQKQAIETAKNSYTTLKIAYDKAVDNLDEARKKAETDIASYGAMVNQAQADLEDAKNPPRNVDIASYQAALYSAQASLAQAVANRNKGRIYSPVDGTIGKLEFKLGEYVSPQSVAVKLVSPHFEAEVDIPETDIVKINIGDKADIKLDAYGDDIKLVGEVMQIEKGETIIQDVVYYNVKLSLEDNENIEILNGMTASVIFYTAKIENVLIIPLRAIRATENGKYVRVLENNRAKDVLIITGLRGDGGMVEIVEGLSEGQDIITNSNGK